MALFNKKDKSKRKKVELIKKLEYKKREKVPSNVLLKRFIIFFIILTLFGSTWLIAKSKMDLRDLLIQISLEEDKLDKIKEEVNSLKNNSVISTKEIEKFVNSAANAGRDVALLQNKYKDLNVIYQPDAIFQNAKEIDKYLAEDSKAERIMWFDGKNLNKKVSWEFMSTYSFSGDLLNVVWTCVDDQNVIYAFATGIYDVKTNTFSQVKHAFTSVGGQTVGATIENDYKTHFDEIIKKLQDKNEDLTSDNIKPYFDEKIKDEISNARDAIRKDQNN